MATLAGTPSTAPGRDDRNAFLIFVGLVWIGILSGFGTDSYGHISKHGLDYPLIVHVHAVAFVAWLVLFTVQVALIRNGNRALHRRLGVAGAMLALFMVLIAPPTALIVDAARYARSGRTPEFLAIQLSDVVAFATLTAAGLLLRERPAAHKRLMLLGLFYISGAGFARYLNDLVAAPLGDTPLGNLAGLYFGSTALIVGLGVYDLVTRRRLHPAYVAGFAWTIAIQTVAVYLLTSSPGWKALSLRMIGA